MVEVFKRNLGVISSLCISLCISPIFLGCKRLKCHKCKWRCGGCCRAAAQTCPTWPPWPCWPCPGRDRGDRHRDVDRPWSCGTSCGCWPRPRQGLMAAWCGGGGRGPHQVDSHHVSSEGLHQAVSKPGAERLLRGFVMVICEFLKLGLPSVLGPQHKLCWREWGFEATAQACRN